MKHLLILVIALFAYPTFEVIFNAITFSQLNTLLGKKRIALFGYTSLWLIPVGGLIVLLLSLIYSIPGLSSLPKFPVLMLIGCIVITALELGSGMLFNKVLKIGIWDYSNIKIKLFGKVIPLNFKGQISVYHSLGWFGLSYLIFKLLDFINFIISKL